MIPDSELLMVSEAVSIIWHTTVSLAVRLKFDWGIMQATMHTLELSLSALEATNAVA